MLRKELVGKQLGLCGFLEATTEELGHSAQEVPVSNEEEDPSQELEFKVETKEYTFNDVIVENHLEEVDQIPNSQPPKSKLWKPKSLYSPAGKVVCDKCGNSCCKNHLRRHIDVVLFKLRRFSCDLCDYQTFEKEDMRKHMIKHISKESRKRIRCSDCNKTFTTQQGLNYHMYARHRKFSKAFHCHICEKQYSKKRDLEIHKTSHTAHEIGQLGLK